MMCAHSFLLVLSACFCSSSSSHVPRPSSSESGCFKVNSCKCIMKDGSGVISLKAMGDADGFLGRGEPVPAENLPGSPEVLLSFSPCQPFSVPEDLPGAECTNVAVCFTIRYQRLSRRISRYIGYGRHEGNQFSYNQSLQLLSVSYFSNGEQPSTVVRYHCNPNQSTSVIRDQSLSAGGPLQIWVESPCACPNACAMGDLGLGTIFLIILSLSAAAYFLLGSCALRASRSSGGVQIHPEHSMWCTMCCLCVDRQPGRRGYAGVAHSEQ
ncbi:uncharacterized protein [Antennarius striatus]|uniref:uncharacterized protein n=1 Tax=Antennarius striatus TaxID=241820 RepID=UPI0035AE16AC